MLFHRCLRSMPFLLILRLEFYFYYGSVVLGFSECAYIYIFHCLVLYKLFPPSSFFVYDSQEVYLRQLVILAHTVGTWYVFDHCECCITADVISRYLNFLESFVYLTFSGEW